MKKIKYPSYSNKYVFWVIFLKHPLAVSFWECINSRRFNLTSGAWEKLTVLRTAQHYFHCTAAVFSGVSAGGGQTDHMAYT